MFLTSERIAKYISFPYPIEVKSPHTITQYFGENGTVFYKQLGLKGHNGVDFNASIGTPIYAVFDGEVTAAQTFGDGGVGIFINSNPFEAEGEQVVLCAIYWHLSALKVKARDAVRKGDLIGLSGNTGRYTTGPHLHFGIKSFEQKNGEWAIDQENGFHGAIDPLPFFNGENHKIFPVDRNYDLVFDGFQQPAENKVWFEYIKEIMKVDKFVEKKLGRKPTEQELTALSYGQYPVDELTEVNRTNWMNDSYIEFRAKILQSKSRI